MHKTLLPHKNAYAVSEEETETHDKLSPLISCLAEKVNATWSAIFGPRHCLCEVARTGTFSFKASMHTQ